MTRAAGVMLGVDPTELPPGALADAINVDLNRVLGAVVPRRGTRSLVNADSSPTCGHPSDPLGNDAWDNSARIPRLIFDDNNRRLWALATISVADDVASLTPYIFDLTQKCPGGVGV